MNYFFKFLLPQLLEYFNNDKGSVKEFVPNIIEKQLNQLSIEDKGKEYEDKRTN